MFRKLATALVAVSLTSQPAAAGQKSTVAKQHYIVHVPSKVTAGPVPLSKQSTTESSTNGEPDAPGIGVSESVAAYRIAGTNSAGLLVQFEVQPPNGGQAGAGNPQANLSIRVASEDDGNWIVSEAGDPAFVEASSDGTGAATFVLGTNATPREIEIVATVISKE